MEERIEAAKVDNDRSPSQGRARLVRDSSKRGPQAATPVLRFSLHSGEMYRIAYSVGGTPQRRVSRSIAVFAGESKRRNWGGEVVPVLDFALPQGRTISLLAEQLVDARAATQNEHGQWVLLTEERGVRRRRHPARLLPN